MIAEVCTALTAARSIIAAHRPYGYGMCVCLRPIVSPAGCSVAWRAQLYAEHWRSRIEYWEDNRGASPTMLLPLLVAA